MENTINPENQDNITEVLEVAAEAGHIMLENGAEIARVEETMERISAHYGITSRNFFVLSNGIFTTGSGKYANVEFIPIKGTQMEKIVATNTLSRAIEAGKYTIPEAKDEIARIRAMKPKPAWEQILGSAFGSAGFCAIFGGSLLDCAAAFVTGIILWAFVLVVTAPYVSKMLGNILGGMLATALCFVFYKAGFGNSLGNMVVGALIPLIPGVAFLNGIRDLVNEDYIAGTTRLLDALIVFLGIALGACLVFITHGHISGGVIMLEGALTSPETANLAIQVAAAFIGTVAFAVLFGSPNNQYVSCGIVGAIGWAVYYLVINNTQLSIAETTFITSCVVVALARQAAKIRKCPKTVFLLCGLFPLIPGGGIFWTTYFLITKQYQQALSSGMTAISVTLAIVLGIVVITGLPRLKKLRPVEKAKNS